MAKEMDSYDTTTAVSKTFEAETWPTAFSTTPQVCLMDMADKKKSGCKNITSTGADISCETNDLRIWLRTQGYSVEVTDSHPESDADAEAISASKVYQAASFNSTFDAAPYIRKSMSERIYMQAPAF